MSFFKNKEEVIDLQLTSYGRQTLSKGVFKPAYYAFFDDDIIYDSMSYRELEGQNNTQTRILEGTPYLKTQFRFSSASTNSSEEMDYSRFLGIPLADADDSIQYAPSFNLNFIKGMIDRVNLTSSDIQNKMGSDSIPQIYLKPEYIDVIIDEKYSSIEMNNKDIFYPPRPDDSYVKIVPKEIIFDIFEENIEYFSKNFDIEVHKIHNGVTEKLKFEKNIGINEYLIVDDMLTTKVIKQQDMTEDALQEDSISSFRQEDTELVTSYFNISFDDMSEEITTNRLYIYEPITDISPKGNNC